MHFHDALYKCLNILAENEVEEEEEEQPKIGTFARSRCLQVRSLLSSDHLALPGRGHCHRKVGSPELHLWGHACPCCHLVSRVCSVLVSWYSYLISVVLCKLKVLKEVSGS